jgi:hypothetical protein
MPIMEPRGYGVRRRRRYQRVTVLDEPLTDAFAALLARFVRDFEMERGPLTVGERTLIAALDEDLQHRAAVIYDGSRQRARASRPHPNVIALARGSRRVSRSRGA